MKTLVVSRHPVCGLSPGYHEQDETFFAIGPIAFGKMLEPLKVKALYLFVCGADMEGMLSVAVSFREVYKGDFYIVACEKCKPTETVKFLGTLPLANVKVFWVKEHGGPSSFADLLRRVEKTKPRSITK